MNGGKIDRTYWELATYFGVSSALASGDLWVPTSRIHRSLEDLLRPRVPATTKTPVPLPRIPRLSADEWIRSEEHTSELQSLMRISYAVFCLKKKTIITI